MVLFIDSFLFNGENIVKMRLEYLYNFVDYFYIVESIYTFSGIRKDLYYIDKYRIWFEPYLDKIVFVKIENTSNTIGFSEEKYQRNYIRNILLENYKNNEFILALCDIDEIYNYTLLNKETLFTELSDKTILFTMKMYYYTFENLVDDNWEMAFLISSNMLKNIEDLDYVRVNKLGSSTLRQKNGWHFSYFMSPEEIKRKIESFSHMDLNKPPYNDVNYIDFVSKKGIHIFQQKQLNKISFNNSIHNYPELFRKYY